jgi:hypothetical protein
VGQQKLDEIYPSLKRIIASASFFRGTQAPAGISDDRMNEIQYKKTEGTKGLKKFTLHTMRRVPDDF